MNIKKPEEPNISQDIVDLNGCIFYPDLILLTLCDI